MRFRDLAFVLQMPHLDLAREAERAKGSMLTAEERRALEERASYARFWLATYAPPEFKYELQQEPPPVELSKTQKAALASLARFLEEGEKKGDEIHTRLHELKSEIPIAPKELFASLYRIFLARDSGPQAGWFLASLPRAFVLERLVDASAR